MILDTSAGRGAPYLLKSTPTCLIRLRTGQQEVPGISSINRGFVGLSLSQHGFQHLAMLFHQQELKSCIDSPKLIASDSLYIHAYKYYATAGIQTGYLVCTIVKQFKIGMISFYWQWIDIKLFNWIFRTHIQCSSSAVCTTVQQYVQWKIHQRRLGNTTSTCWHSICY